MQFEDDYVLETTYSIVIIVKNTVPHFSKLLRD